MAELVAAAAAVAAVAAALEVPAAAEVVPQAAEVPQLDTQVGTRLGSLGTLVLRKPLQVPWWSEA